MEIIRICVWMFDVLVGINLLGLICLKCLGILMPLEGLRSDFADTDYRPCRTKRQWQGHNVRR